MDDMDYMDPGVSEGVSGQKTSTTRKRKNTQDGNYDRTLGTNDRSLGSTRLYSIWSRMPCGKEFLEEPKPDEIPIDYNDNLVVNPLADRSNDSRLTFLATGPLQIALEKYPDLSVDSVCENDKREGIGRSNTGTSDADVDDIQMVGEEGINAEEPVVNKSSDSHPKDRVDEGDESLDSPSDDKDDDERSDATDQHKSNDQDVTLESSAPQATPDRTPVLPLPSSELLDCISYVFAQNEAIKPPKNVSLNEHMSASSLLALGILLQEHTKYLL
ncbi:hypothetical protein GGI07_003623 [Coemansia sp. Benny D115]|nr:hypothetical protein GGI07_003623 [Coemansia sp. Benny D115]